MMKYSHIRKKKNCDFFFLFEILLTGGTVDDIRTLAIYC